MKKLFNDVGDTLNKVLYGLPKGLSPDESLRLVVATSRDAADAAVNRMLGVKS